MMAAEPTPRGPTTYLRTQPGTVIRWAFSIPIAALLAGGAIGIWPCYAAAGLGLMVLLAFHSLTVQVDDAAIRLRFGPGLIARSIPLDQIATCRAVRNRWFYGFGIRYTFTGWMWNVSGLDAVELTYTSGKRFRIGTDDPQELAAAIRRDAPHQPGRTSGAP